MQQTAGITLTTVGEPMSWTAELNLWNKTFNNRDIIIRLQLIAWLTFYLAAYKLKCDYPLETRDGFMHIIIQISVYRDGFDFSH